MIQGIIVLFTVLLIMVGVHEWGHMRAAKSAGVMVPVYKIFFGKAIYSFTRGEGLDRTRYEIGWIPLGGYIKIAGMEEYLQGELTHEQAHQKPSYFGASYWEKTKILLAGVTMNALTAWTCFTLAIWIGLPNDLLGTRYDDVDIAWYMAPIAALVAAVLLMFAVVVGFIGILIERVQVLYQAITGFFTSGSTDVTVDDYLAIEETEGNILVNIINDVSGAATDPVLYLLILGFASCLIGGFNLIPFPALDGGRWLLHTIYKVARRPLTALAMRRIFVAGNIALIVLVFIPELLLYFQT